MTRQYEDGYDTCVRCGYRQPRKALAVRDGELTCINTMKCDGYKHEAVGGTYTHLNGKVTQ